MKNEVKKWYKNEQNAKKDALKIGGQVAVSSNGWTDTKQGKNLGENFCETKYIKTEDLKMINIKIDEEQLLDLLNERVEHWTDDRDVQALYKQMYENYIYSGCFEGIEIDINVIVDNDYINYCDVICEGEDEYEQIAKIYNEQGLGDCSCECDCCSYIEAEYNKMFLIRR